MALFPGKSTGIRRLIKRARRSLANKPTDPKAQPKTYRIPVHENEYFTFDKSGRLIDLDDEVVEAIEHRVQEEWRQSYLNSTQATAQQETNG